MCRCRICDKFIERPHFNRQHGDIDPCGTCLEVINNVFSDDPLADEEMIIETEPTAEELMADVEEAYYHGPET